jgi:hypothetical protein
VGHCGLFGKQMVPGWRRQDHGKERNARVFVFGNSVRIAALFEKGREEIWRTRGPLMQMHEEEVMHMHEIAVQG